MSRRSRNNLAKSSKLTIGKIVFRFFIWLFCSVAILLAGVIAYFYITFNGPSKHAADELATKLSQNDYLMFIPDVFSYDASGEEVGNGQQ